ncbi:MAG: hypothetical protein ACOXZW_03285 [Bacilli bacterium]|jgi:hypothetical protein
MNDTRVKNKKNKGKMMEPLVDEKIVLRKHKNKLFTNLIIGAFLLECFLPFTIVKEKYNNNSFTISSQYENINANPFEDTEINLINKMSYEEILDNNTNIAPEYKIMLFNIIKVLHEKLPNQKFPYLKVNLCTLSIERRNLNGPCAIYMRDENIIALDSALDIREIVSVLSHEFAHMMNRNYDFNTGTFNLGFSTDINGERIGNGLEEGMATLFKEKIISIIPNNQHYISYKRELLIIEALIEIIGYEKMINYYCNSDLNGFINELQEINGNKRRVINFIKNIDFISYMTKDKTDYNLVNESSTKKKIEASLLDYFVTKYINDIKLGIYDHSSNGYYNLKYRVDYFHQLLDAEGSVYNMLTNKANIEAIKGKIFKSYFTKNNISISDLDDNICSEREIVEYNRVYGTGNENRLEIYYPEAINIFYDVEEKTYRAEVIKSVEPIDIIYLNEDKQITNIHKLIKYIKKANRF